MIIVTSDNRFYLVAATGCADLDHVWYGIPVKKVNGEYVVTIPGRRAGKMELVRKLGSRKVEA